MPRTVRFAAALLVLASLTCGSLGALPLSPRITSAENGRGDFLMAFVEWIASLFPRDPDKIPNQPQTKDGAYIDPSGGK